MAGPDAPGNSSRSCRPEDLKSAGAEFYNSLEAPALEKYPLLALYQEFLRANGATVTLMSGSGSTTFAVLDNPDRRPSPR